jgi:DnaJ-class molecular chaperone
MLYPHGGSARGDMADDDCSLCHGEGYLWSEPDPANAGMQVKVTCPLCGGTGKK